MNQSKEYLLRVQQHLLDDINSGKPVNGYMRETNKIYIFHVTRYVKDELNEEKFYNIVNDFYIDIMFNNPNDYFLLPLDVINHHRGIYLRCQHLIDKMENREHKYFINLYASDC